MELREFNFEGKKYSVTLRDEADASVFSEIFNLREYRIAEKYITDLVYPIIDVGAHAGFFTLYARALNPLVPIFAVEPESKNFQKLSEHLKNNSVSATVARAAFAKETGNAELFISKDSHNHELVPATVKTDGKTETVQTYSLNDFCEKYKINTVGLLKMDIEGGEYAVLESFDASMFRRTKAILMEYHEYFNQTYKDIEAQLRENGFGVQVFPSKFDSKMGFLWALNKRSK